jgi:O-antigen/teichoic acid export membrane protein
VTANRLRVLLILVLAVAAVVSVVGEKTGSAAVGWVSFALFLLAVALYFQWRRAVHVARGRVFDREAKTSDETRARTDQ